jgi:hypothetical protein
MRYLATLKFQKMKKQILVPLAGCALLLTISSHSIAQGKNNLAIAGIREYHFNRHDIAALSGGKMAALKPGEVSIKAVRDFAEISGQIEDVKWYKSDEGFMAYYTRGSNKLMAGYNLKGNWIYSMATYNEDKLQRDIRHLVKSTYYDFTITLVNEIKTGSKTIYIVHMKDKATWLNVRVCDGEMEVAERYSEAE